MKKFSLRNRRGFGVDILDWGGSVTSILVPDRNSQPVDVALGWSDINDYNENPGYLGALIGRVANRISNGRFQLDGVTYQSILNDGNRPCSLHGGNGYSHRYWQVREFNGADHLVLCLHSPDGDSGYPGALDLTVSYTFTADNELVLEYSAVCDRKTVINPTSHIYFNLNGEDSGDTSDLKIMINASAVTEVNNNLLPTGKMLPIAGTPFDLRDFRLFREIIAEMPDGLDHNFVIAGESGCLRRAATVVSQRTGIVMDTITDRPGVQFYMAGFLTGEPAGKSGPYDRFAGFCLETQNFPDAPNQPDFPSAVLEAGDIFKTTTIYRFSNDGN